MGKATTSCLKIITCGSDSKDEDVIDVDQNKASVDKCGWSFRKRSARHRVLSNSVITESTPPGCKDGPETGSINFQLPAHNPIVSEKTSVIEYADEKPKLSTLENTEDASLNFQPPANFTAPEKTSVVDCSEEKSELSIPEKTKESETKTETENLSQNDSEVEVVLEDSEVIVIQTAIRGVLAQRELLKLKNVVKLQAAVRGHLVRRHAVGTLRCVQAIVKMQALVRARRARLLLEKSSAEKVDGKKEKAKILDKKESSKPSVTYISIDKLLSNKFARVLMQSTPRTKPINIKCDPSKRDSSWKWLERWMSFSSVDVVGPDKEKFITKDQERENIENFESQVSTAIEPEHRSGSEDTGSYKESILPSESGDNIIDQSPHTISSARENLEQSQSESTGISDLKLTSLEEDSVSEVTEQSNISSQLELSFLTGKAEIDTEPAKQSVKRLALESEEQETEGKKLRKVSNPSFIAAQLKFEEQSSKQTSGRSTSLPHQGNGAESYMEPSASKADSETRVKEEIIAEENSTLPESGPVQVGSFKGSPELSVSSTLDSPDLSDAGAVDDEQSTNVLVEDVHNPSGIITVEDTENNPLTIPASQPDLHQPQKVDIVSNESITSEAVFDSPLIDVKLEKINASDLQRDPDTEMSCQAYRSSPEASPRSHITVPESQGTPSSQISVKAKRNMNDKTVSGKKRKSLSAGKKSPLNENHNSGTSTGVEHFPKDKKNGKRRESFGSPRPDHIEQEPRSSSSNSSLPRFMQPTESARAKVSNSPRSSPDTQDREIYIKKRHSLPGANGKGSPRVQQSSSPVQQGGKGNGSHSPHERKWQR